MRENERRDGDGRLEDRHEGRPEARREGGEKSLERQIRAFHWIRLLSELRGRLAGTDQEGEAAHRVELWLRDLGLEDIALGSVPSRPRPGVALAAHAGLAALGVLVAGLPGFALAALAAFSFRREASGGAPLLSRWLPARDSSNVVARVGSSRPRRRVVLVSHLDAAQASPLFAGRHRSWLARPRADGSGAPRGDRLLPSRLLAVTALVLFASALGAEGALMTLSRVVVGVALLGMLVAGLRWARDADAAGANDNASGIAAMLTAVEQLAAQVPPDVELVCAATGAGQPGFCGVQALLAAHPEWRGDDTAFVVFDAIGGGDLHYARSEGGLVRTPHPPLLTELARRVSASGAYGAVTPADLPFDTAARDLARRGAPVLSLVSLQPDGLPLRWRESDDTPEQLDTETVIRAADFGCCVLSAWLRGDAEPLAYV